MSGQVYPLEQWLILKGDEVFGEDYGRSVFRSVYRFYWAKTICLKKLVLYLDKMSLAHLILKHVYDRDGNPIGFDDKDVMQTVYALEHLEESFGVPLPIGFDISALPIPNNGTMGYIQAADWYNKEILRAILGTSYTAMGSEPYSGIKTMAYMTVSGDIANSKAELLKRVLEEQIYNRIFAYNGLVKDVNVDFKLPNSNASARMDLLVKAKQIGYTPKASVLASILELQESDLELIQNPAPYLQGYNSIGFKAASKKKRSSVLTRAYILSMVKNAAQLKSDIKKTIMTYVNADIKGKTTFIKPSPEQREKIKFSIAKLKGYTFLALLDHMDARFGRFIHANKSQATISLKVQVSRLQKLALSFSTSMDNNYDKIVNDWLDKHPDMSEREQAWVREQMDSITKNSDINTDKKIEEIEYRLSNIEKVADDIEFNNYLNDLDEKMSDYEDSLDRELDDGIVRDWCDEQEEYRQENLGEDVVPGYECIAVLDDATTYRCGEIDGHYIAYGSGSSLPPFDDHNCRTVPSPVDIEEAQDENIEFEDMSEYEDLPLQL